MSESDNHLYQVVFTMARDRQRKIEVAGKIDRRHALATALGRLTPLTTWPGFARS